MGEATYRIIGDSGCDFAASLGELGFLTRVPLTIQVGDEAFTDDASLDHALLLDKMRACSEAPRSACPSPERFMQLCTEQPGDVYIVTLSSKLSGSYGSARLGVELAKERGCTDNMNVFDSLSAAAGEIAVCLFVRALAEAGVPFAEVVARTEAYIADMQTYFVLETLDVFRKNGRLNHLQALAVGALRLKFVMGGERGMIAVRGKALSTGRAISRMIEMVREKAAHIDVSVRTLVVTHINCLERAEDIVSRITAHCPFARTLICNGGGISTMYGNDGGIILAF